jgi:large subunit ribosomal protein L29
MDLVTAEQKLSELRHHLFNLRLQKERGEVKNNRQFPQTKADIARLMQHIGDLHHATEMEAAGLLSEPEETELVPVDAHDAAGEANEADESSEDEA